MTTETLLKIIFIQTALSGIVSILCFYKFKRRSKEVKLVGLLFLVGFIVTVVQIYFAALRNPSASVYDFISIIIMGLLFDHVTGSRYRKLILVFTFTFIVFGVYNLFFIQKGFISSYNKLLGSFIVIVYAVLYFYRLMTELPTTHVQRFPMFWFNAAFLIFNAGALFLFAFTDYLVNVLNNDLVIYWSFHNILNILEHFLILIGLSYDLKNLKVGKSDSVKSISVPR